ncbi:MAG: DUF4132 domain-containing protein [Planctomycetes bacterium]|nr:DUF4132 domain-containing protein [Planctomycetota bacterium]
MLNPEVASKQLDQWRIKKLFDERNVELDDGNDFDLNDGEQATRFVKKLGSLPAKLAKIGYGLYGLTDKGAVYSEKQFNESIKRRNQASRDLDQLSSRDRIQILAVMFPKMASDVNRTWEQLRSAPYTVSWTKKAFRAPRNHAVSLSHRRDWLSLMFNLAEHFHEEHLTPVWLATWVTHIRIGYSNYQQEVGCLLAGVIDAGGKPADAVFEILSESARNEHDIGGMGQHVTQALLLSSRPDGWELIEKMLLAAQRQEGLRQAILETIDLTHPEAYRRMLRLIRENDLARFSAIIRAVNVWFGFAWDAVTAKVVNSSIDLALNMLEDPAARSRALKGSDPNHAYFSLWATAFEDAEAAIPFAESLLKHKQPEMRFVGCALLGHLELPQAGAIRSRCVDDDDLRIARWALDGNTDSDESDEEATKLALRDKRIHFERLERLYPRLPEKPKKFEAIVWPWTAFEFGREHLSPYLMGALGDQPPTKLLPYVSTFGVWQRRQLVELFAEQKKWDAESRSVVIGMAGDSSADVRTAAFQAVSKLKLTEPEVLRLESMLTRKAGDLRKGVLELALGLKDDQALASADRLLAAKDANQRQAGLELVRQLFEHKRSSDACRARAEAYRTARPKLSKDEQTQVSAVLDVSPEDQALTLENALGLMDPTLRSPVVAPRNRKARVISEGALRNLKSLDDLIHKHRETPIILDRKTNQQELLGTVRWGFPSYNSRRSPEKEAAKLPMREVWEAWNKSRPKSDRDADGMELWRATTFHELTDSWRGAEVFKWAATKQRTAFAELLMTKLKPVKLKYEPLVRSILDWLQFLHPYEHEIDTTLDIAETLFSLVSEADLKELVPKPKPAKKGKSPRNDDDDDDDDDNEKDWRRNELFEHWLPDGQIDKLTDAQFTRLWHLLHWRDRPIAGALPRSPGWDSVQRAYSLGLANIHEVANELAGPRSRSYYSLDNFNTLTRLTQRKLHADDERFLQQHPEVADLVRRCVAIILDTELNRGETPTLVTNAAGDLGALHGMPTLIRILTALGKTGFKSERYYYNNTPRSRAQSLTRLASITYPAADETVDGGVALLKAAIKADAFPEERLFELAFLAPQWVKYMEAYFKWKGMSEGLYWFLAHMQSWGSDVAERAAVGAGLEEEDDDEANEDLDDDDDDDTSDESGETPPKDVKPPRLSPWERLILERTSLTDQERSDGAIDIAWFRRVYAELGEARWKQLAVAARYAANASQAKKAQLLADVLLGKASLDDLIKGIKTKYLKEYVRLLGLFPLPTGAKRDVELKRRFEVLQEYGRYAKTLSGLTKPEALRSLEIGLRNLAGTAGFPDPIRLDWALGAETLKDLAAGPVKATKDGVTVTLILDEQTQPQITIARGEKLLKSAPPAVKKDKVVAGLFERSKELKRQVSRQRQSLEAMMCRGETVSATELVSLCTHALVAPLLQRLVFIGDGVFGYPDKKGKSLRNHAGKLVAIPKSASLRIAHPYDLFKSGDWDKWQHDCFQAERIQPFKQIFRELYVVTKQEKADDDRSKRYTGQQVNPRQAYALWGQRGWNTDEGVFKTFHEEDIIASVSFDYGFTTPAEVEGPTIGSIHFMNRDEYKVIPLAKVPPRLFSEVMRDMDLVVSVAHAGGVDPEATASTVEMRINLLRETCQLLSLKNVRFKASQAVIDGQLGQYTVHLGSGTVHRMPGGSVCIVPVHSQHRGRLFLPFADNDPRTAEVMSKVLLLARDQEILDPSILDQLRA